MAWRANMVWKSQAIVTGRGSARLERTVRVREVGGSNPPAPTARRGCPFGTAPCVYPPYSLPCPLRPRRTQGHPTLRSGCRRAEQLGPPPVLAGQAREDGGP